MFNKVFNIFFSNQIYSCTGFFNHLCMIGIGSPLKQKKKKNSKPVETTQKDQENVMKKYTFLR